MTDKKDEMPWQFIRLPNLVKPDDSIEGRFIPEQVARELWEVQKRQNILKVYSIENLMEENAKLKKELFELNEKYRRLQIGFEAAKEGLDSLPEATERMVEENARLRSAAKEFLDKLDRAIKSQKDCSKHGVNTGTMWLLTAYEDARTAFIDTLKKHGIEINND